jgi:hypothetical protein
MKNSGGLFPAQSKKISLMISNLAITRKWLPEKYLHTSKLREADTTPIAVETAPPLASIDGIKR